MENENRRNSGFARAKSLTPEQRKAIAQKAADARWSPDIRRATHMGELNVGDLSIPCAVLEDGQRVISLKAVGDLFGRRPGGRAYKEWRTESAGLPVFLSSNHLKRFISAELAETASKPIQYRPSRGGPIASGLPASILPDICVVWIDAQKAGAIKGIASEKAEILMRAFAKLGIDALVDEATGYQEIRDRRALQIILDKYLSKEFAAWAKQFPDEFYKQIFRLRNWPWKGIHVNRPQCVARYTTDLVYERLAPNIVDELEKRNPVENGRRKSKHHQWLTPDIGHPALSQHLHAIIGFMRANDDWTSFKRQIDRAFPRKGDTIPMF